MQPNLNRLLRALAREGLDVTYDGRVYTVRLQRDAHAPPAEVLLLPTCPWRARPSSNSPRSPR
ncbi:hypothetical protein ACN28S_55650 [Cystobacter fuscus]